ncbi:hypothetical protein BDQ17DRAFT_1337846 [Cyathus striatus]|nr:hypothetical protein BDQ17DRAFT_1337846 [Cyathus striatus]
MYLPHSLASFANGLCGGGMSQGVERDGTTHIVGPVDGVPGQEFGGHELVGSLHGEVTECGIEPMCGVCVRFGTAGPEFCVAMEGDELEGAPLHPAEGPNPELGHPDCDAPARAYHGLCTTCVSVLAIEGERTQECG